MHKLVWNKCEKKDILKDKDMKKELVLKTLTILMWVSVAVLLIFSYTRSSEVNEALFGEFQSFDVYEKIAQNPLFMKCPSMVKTLAI